MTDTVVFSALLNRDSYLPGLWDLLRDDEARSYWVRALAANSRHMLDSFMKHEGSDLRTRCDEAHDKFCRFLETFDRTLDPDGPRTVNELTEARQRIFTNCGIPDPYRPIKEAENEKALAFLREFSSEVPPEVPQDQRWRWVFSLVMAGNFFDMGSAEARRFHRNATGSIFDRATELAQRPWFRDDLDELSVRLKAGPRADGSVVICIDNAGAEIVLGATALVRLLTSAGFRCTLVANEAPSLNDMTFSETAVLLEKIAAIEPDLKSLIDSGRLSLISSGSHTSGLNMLKVSRSFDTAASKAELLIVLGQGRAVETNWSTKLNVPWARVTTVKDRTVAGAVGCDLFDLLLTFEEPQ